MEHIIYPLTLSLKVAFWATIFSLISGLVCAYWFAFSKSKWARVVSILTALPLVLPPTVLGYYLLIVIGRHSILGQWVEQIFGFPLVFTWYAAVLAATIASLPLVIRPIQSAFEMINRTLLHAAQLDGANGWQLLRYIIIPLSARGILAGIVLGFARAMGEFGATLMVAGNIPGKTQTLSIAIYDAVQANRMNDAHLMVMILSVITISILLFVNMWINKKHY